MILPLLILGGIYGGFFTPTEAAAIAVVYTIPVGLFVYRELTLRKIAAGMVHAATTTGIIMIILVFSMVASRIFTLERIPQELTDFLLITFNLFKRRDLLELLRSEPLKPRISLY